jgi:hypothetical protein
MVAVRGYVTTFVVCPISSIVIVARKEWVWNGVWAGISMLGDAGIGASGDAVISDAVTGQR